MFIINGFVGLEARDIEELQSATGPSFCHTMYELQQFRGMLEFALKNCSNRLPALSAHKVDGERANGAGELWNDFSECLMAKGALESTLMDLADLSGNLQPEGLEECAHECVAMTHDTPCCVAAVSSSWIN